MMKTVTLCDMPVRVDDDELISLTDMWKASGERRAKEPSKFLKLKDTEAFLQELNTQNLGGLKKEKGRQGGTWGCKFLAYKYAAWIDKAFEVGVFAVLDKFFTGELLVQPQQELHDHVLLVKMSEQVGSFHGKGLNRRRLEKKELEQEGLRLLQKYQQQFNFTPKALLSH